MEWQDDPRGRSPMTEAIEETEKLKQHKPSYIAAGPSNNLVKENDQLSARVNDLNEVRHRQNCKIIDLFIENDKLRTRVAEIEAEMKTLQYYQTKSSQLEAHCNDLGASLDRMMQDNSDLTVKALGLEAELERLHKYKRWFDDIYGQLAVIADHDEKNRLVGFRISELGASLDKFMQDNSELTVKVHGLEAELEKYKEFHNQFRSDHKAEDCLMFSQRLQAENERLLEELRIVDGKAHLYWAERNAMKATNEFLNKENYRLREVLEKIAEWGCNGQCIELIKTPCPCCIAKAALEVDCYAVKR